MLFNETKKNYKINISGLFGISAQIIKLGDKVKITENKYSTGKNIPKCIKNYNNIVCQINNDKVLVKNPYGIKSWFMIDDVKLCI